MKRNTRIWFEDGDTAMLAKHPNGTPTPVRILSLHGDHTGEAVYIVQEVAHPLQQYPASERQLTRPTKGGAELAKMRAAIALAACSTTGRLTAGE